MKLNQQNLKQALQGITIIEVSGESCANCLTLYPILNQIIKNRSDCVLHHLEIDENTAPIALNWHIESVPTILIMKDEEEYARCRGYQPYEILELWIDAKIEQIKEKFGIN
ncbi:MAG: thioredoxin family protein [Anaeroplasmataceae bacterium]|nr:thioredoxin family protein [Anaeroplasmataceae bacterium]